eukprot:COSAG04_NODE_1159_length_8037_cov_3.743890_3_plen_277_part_00
MALLWCSQRLHPASLLCHPLFYCLLSSSTRANLLRENQRPLESVGPAGVLRDHPVPRSCWCCYLHRLAPDHRYSRQMLPVLLLLSSQHATPRENRRDDFGRSRLGGPPDSGNAVQTCALRSKGSCHKRTPKSGSEAARRGPGPRARIGAPPTASAAAHCGCSVHHGAEPGREGPRILGAPTTTAAGAANVSEGRAAKCTLAADMTEAPPPQPVLTLAPGGETQQTETQGVSRPTGSEAAPPAAQPVRRPDAHAAPLASLLLPVPARPPHLALRRTL